MSRADIAKKLVLGDRNADYGDPRPDLDGVALVWTGLLLNKLKPGAFITAEDVALLMVGLKLRRETVKPKADNGIDAHGWLLVHEWVQTGVRP